MTFEEAVQLKERVGNTKEIEGKKWNIYIVPTSEEDFKRFAEIAYREWPDLIPNHIARQLCTDGNFEVRAFYFEDGIFFHDLID